MFLLAPLCSGTCAAEPSVGAWRLSPSPCPFSALPHQSALWSAVHLRHCKKTGIRIALKWGRGGYNSIYRSGIWMQTGKKVDENSLFNEVAEIREGDAKGSHLSSGGLYWVLELLQLLLHPNGVLNERQILLGQLCHQVQQLLGVGEVQLWIVLQAHNKMDKNHHCRTRSKACEREENEGELTS